MTKRRERTLNTQRTSPVVMKVTDLGRDDVSKHDHGGKLEVYRAGYNSTGIGEVTACTQKKTTAASANASPINEFARVDV